VTAPATATTGFLVNGNPVEVSGPGGRRLLDVLRCELGLTGTKEGCGEGECGACTVLLDGEVVDSCLVPVCQIDGHAVETVEGLAEDGELNGLQAAFLETGGAQCGFCTPGMLMSGQAFLRSGAEPTERTIREAIAGNLCRCTGYSKIVEAIRLAAQVPPGGGPVPAPPHRPSPNPRIASGTPVATPHTLDEALRAMASGRYRPIAGGTDVMVGLTAAGGLGPDPLLDLWQIDELRGIWVEAGDLVLGSLTTYAVLRHSPVVRERLPVLADLASAVGAAQIQNRGTIGGNIATASPAGDTLPLLLAADASIVVGSVRGTRTIRADEFFTGYRRTAREADELVLRIRIPLREGRELRFRKVGTRRAQAISKVTVAVAWTVDGGRWRDVRVALGSVAERPVRAIATEAVLEGARPTPESADLAARTVAAGISPIDDVRSTAAYRRTVTGRVLRRIVLEAGGS